MGAEARQGRKKQRGHNGGGFPVQRNSSQTPLFNTSMKQYIAMLLLWLTDTKTILYWGSTTVWPFPCLKKTTSKYILRSLQGRLAGFHLFKPSFPFWPSWYQPAESDSRRRVPRMFWMDRCVLYIHLPTDSNVMNVGDKYPHFHFLSLCYGRTTTENHQENDFF